jgi:hypothetical protein
MDHATYQPRKTLVLAHAGNELVPHQCDNGHMWDALMFSVENKRWYYANAAGRFCPECGALRSEIENI